MAKFSDICLIFYSVKRPITDLRSAVLTVPYYPRPLQLSTCVEAFALSPFL